MGEWTWKVSGWMRKVGEPIQNVSGWTVSVSELRQKVIVCVRKGYRVGCYGKLLSRYRELVDACGMFLRFCVN